MIIGICGKSGSGKSTIAKQITSRYKNAVHLDIDKIAHKSHKDEEVKQKIISTFTESVLTNNEIDRKKLGRIVFASKEKMKLLEEITWEFMEKEIDNFIYENKDKIIILDYIVLPLTKYFDKCNIKILFIFLGYFHQLFLINSLKQYNCIIYLSTTYISTKIINTIKTIYNIIFLPLCFI